MKITNAIIGILVAFATIFLWAFMNRPEQEPMWPKQIQGFSFSPMRADDDPTRGLLPTEDEIAEDLALLAGRTHAIRTYTVSDVRGKIPEMALGYDINVALGAWIDARLDKNETEIKRFLNILGHSRNVVRGHRGK